MKNYHLISVALLVGFISGVAAPVHAAPVETFILKCGSTIVTIDDEKEQDGLHRYATWEDTYGYHVKTQLFFNGSMPNDNGLIQHHYLFANSDDNLKITGAGLLLISTPKINKIEYRLTNTAYQGGKEETGKAVFRSGECVQTDHAGSK